MTEFVINIITKVVVIVTKVVPNFSVVDRPTTKYRACTGF